MVNNITAERLAGKIDADEQFTLIDVRPEDSFEAWHVRDAENVSYDPDEGLSEDQLNEVDTLVDGRPVVAICGKGLTSTPFAFELDEHGYDDISVVTGGMEEWSKLYEVVPSRRPATTSSFGRSSAERRAVSATSSARRRLERPSWSMPPDRPTSSKSLRRTLASP